MVKLNIGCGNYPTLKKDWINLDKKGTWSKWEFGPYKDRIEEFNITSLPWNFKSKSVEMVTISHTLNQIPEEYHYCIYKEIYRILIKGGYFRLTDDDNADPRGKYYKNKHEHALTEMIPLDIYNTLVDIGFSNVMFVGEEETNNNDKNIIQNNHKELDKHSKFFLEARK